MTPRRSGPGEELIPLDLVVNYYRGVPASAGLAAATARVTHRGRRFIVAEGEVTGADGRPALRLPAGAQVRGGAPLSVCGVLRPAGRGILPVLLAAVGA
jgi:acyl-coenzyme A thioesterase PaaI-like protein